MDAPSGLFGLCKRLSGEHTFERFAARCPRRAEKVDVCASKGIAYFDLASNAKAGSAETPWAVALTTEKAFPLRVVVHDKSGKEEYRADATRADRKKLDDSLFKPPAAYKKADLAKETKTASLP